MLMKTLRIAVAGLLALSLSMVALTASDKDKEDKDRGNRLRATLIGYDEVPSVNTPASGRFRATISDDGQSIDYTLSFSGIVTAVQQSHIHFAQKSVNGSIVVWLCQGVLRAPAAVATLTPECPQEGTVTGTITAANVLASAATQQLAANKLDAVIAAIRAGSAYANVHSATSGGGEIRGQIKTDDDRDR
jgi:hypothetical protein